MNYTEQYAMSVAGLTRRRDLEGDFVNGVYQYEDIILSKGIVLFGARLRCGYVENADEFYELDICCGAEPERYFEMFVKVLAIIKSNSADYPFMGIPIMSRIKPYPRDDDFVAKIDSLYEKAIR